MRWDSLGEFLALAVSLEFLAEKHHNKRAKLLANALDLATIKLLDNGKSPSRKVNEIDNRGSHFYLAMYWAEAMALQNEDVELQSEFAALFSILNENEMKIVQELNEVQGAKVALDGYYFPDPKKVSDSMKPSSILNAAIETF